MNIDGSSVNQNLEGEITDEYERNTVLSEIIEAVSIRSNQSKVDPPQKSSFAKVFTNNLLFDKHQSHQFPSQ